MTLASWFNDRSLNIVQG